MRYLILIFLTFVSGCAMMERSDRFEVKFDASTRGLTSELFSVGVTFYILIEDSEEKVNEPKRVSVSDINLITSP